MGLIENELRLPMVPLVQPHHEPFATRSARPAASRFEGVPNARSNSRTCACARARDRRAPGVAGCESDVRHEADRLQVGLAAPALEIPPDLNTPQYDDRYTCPHASGLAAQRNARARRGIAVNATADAKIVRAGNERWLVVKATPIEAWNTMRKFWRTSVRARGRAAARSASWRPTGRKTASTCRARPRGMIGKVADVFFNSYKRDKFRTRIEQAREPGTVDIYISHRGAEQVPTTLIDNARRRLRWAVMPPDPGLEAEMLDARWCASDARRRRRGRRAGVGAAPDRARALEKKRRPISSSSTTASTARGAASASRSTASASPSSTATARRARTSSAMPIPSRRRQEGQGIPRQARVLEVRRPESRAVPDHRRGSESRSLVTVQDPNGTPDKSATGEKILSLLRDQLK
jgi:outer membrane protein assembly factor BamC